MQNVNAILGQTPIKSQFRQFAEIGENKLDTRH